MSCRIDMYIDGIMDLKMMIAWAAFDPPGEKEKNIDSIINKAKTRYFPVFEKVSHKDPGCFHLLY